MITAAPPARTCVQRFTIDPAATTVAFTVRKLGIIPVRGTFTHGTSGTLEVRDGRFSGIGTVSLAHLKTPITRRDDHLRSADFFSAADHPTITLQGSGIPLSPTPRKAAVQVTMKGVTRAVPVEVDCTDGDGLRLRATGEIDRHDFGVGSTSFVDRYVVGDRVRFELAFVARRA